MTTQLIAAHGLKMHFPQRSGRLFAPKVHLHAVDGVDLEIAPGEALGLVGESGCGKSTLSRLICRLLDPTEGRIELEGDDITAGSAARFGRSPARRMVQMVFQDPTESLNPRFTVFDLIADPARTLLPKESAGALRRRVEDAADAVSLPHTLLQRFPHQLSGGQKARVGIARALVVEPRLIVLDEPTSALDVSVQATVLQLLDKLRRERGIAMLFVSHDLNVVRLLCQRIAVMYLGLVVEQGTTEEVYHRPAHPYTQALLSAIPNLRGRKGERIKLEGDPQSPFNPPPDRCRFAGRCPVEQPDCTRAAPQLLGHVGSQLVRCFHPVSAAAD
ncbi:ABC transporter ATP-binding protein [Pseudomonas sp. GX19020]|uniref:oligopeptide/dipeptide ABC transporter ATP-binding protein n=1 Tax=Pseudomonas sp. GX19020 TaxID=2942277 RepID=UPI002018E41E|nr:ABC transporter ATP-binding protein [Pseudomonas sp. GX19020]MCL4067529.1 ABC transporter ATP-binding protein [Pseudomonas sp. GX19020]